MVGKISVIRTSTATIAKSTSYIHLINGTAHLSPGGHVTTGRQIRRQASNNETTATAMNTGR